MVRFRYDRQHRSRKKLVVALVLLAGLIAAVLWFNSQYRQPEDATPPPVTSPHKKVVDHTKLDAANAQRKADAWALAHATATFFSADNGHFPSGFAHNALVAEGGNANTPVTLDYYNQLTIVNGAQPPLVGDGLRLVTNATCAETLGGTVAAAPDAYRIYVVEYSFQNVDGSFAARCLTP